MKIQKAESNDEKTVLIGMIVDDVVCGRIASKWTKEMFHSKWSNLVGSWCVKHFERYQKAPGRKIEDRFRSWAEKSKDESITNLVEQFLAGLSEEWSSLKRESNSDYVLDVAGRHFALVQMEKLKNDLEDRIADKDPDKAAELLTGYDPVKLGMSEGIDVLHDKEAWKAAYGPHTEPLIEFPGALGEFFGNAFARHSFVSLEGPEGRGKSYWLQEIAFRAMLQRRKVLFFELGDMTRDQIMERMGCRFAENPLMPGTVQIPRRIKMREVEKDGKPRRIASVEREPKEFTEGMSWQMAYRACKELMEKQIKSRDRYLILHNSAPDMLHCRDIETTLRDLARENWVADVVIVDYSDLLNMSYAKMEGRDCINQTWKHLRKISVLYHCLVVTGTQTNAASNEAWVIRRRHFSEDKRKRAHITAGFGLNQTEDEKDEQVMRLNNLKKRRGPSKESFCVYVAGCLDIANPAVRSSF